MHYGALVVLRNMLLWHFVTDRAASVAQCVDILSHNSSRQNHKSFIQNVSKCLTASCGDVRYFCQNTICRNMYNVLVILASLASVNCVVLYSLMSLAVDQERTRLRV